MRDRRGLLTIEIDGKQKAAESPAFASVQALQAACGTRPLSYFLSPHSCWPPSPRRLAAVPANVSSSCSGLCSCLPTCSNTPFHNKPQAWAGAHDRPAHVNPTTAPRERHVPETLGTVGYMFSGCLGYPVGNVRYSRVHMFGNFGALTKQSPADARKCLAAGPTPTLLALHCLVGIKLLDAEHRTAVFVPLVLHNPLASFWLLAVVLHEYQC